MNLTKQNQMSLLLAVPSLILFGPAGLILVASHRFLQEVFTRTYKALAIRAIRKRVFAPELRLA